MFALAMMAGSAQAHIADIIAGVDVLTRGPDAPVSLEATFGLLVGRDDGQVSWTCHEAVTVDNSIFLPLYEVSSAGEWLAVLQVSEEGRDGQPMFHSPAGCAWNPVEGLDGVAVNYAAYDPNDPMLAYAVTSTPAGGGVHRSIDGGRTWSQDLPGIADRVLHSVHVVDGEVYASGTNGAGSAAFVWHRDAKGVWSDAALPALGMKNAVHRVLAASDDAVYLSLDPPGDDTLYVADRALTTFSIAIEGQGEILDGALGPDGLWLPVDFGERALILAEDGTVTERESPASVGVGVAADGRVLLASLAYIDGPLMNVRTAEGSYEPLLYPDDILGPLDCPAGTETADVCGPLWEQLAPRLQGFDLPPGDSDTGGEPEPTDAGSCGCVAVSGPAQGMSLAVLLLALGFRRRR